jgi:hypothetical protein
VRTRVALGALALFAVGLFARQHLLAELVLPPPWPDEAAFSFPAKALAEHFTLVAPELNPARAILWMPPGYFWALAGWFLITAPTLVAARWFSWFAVSAALLVLGHASWRRHRSLAALLTLGAAVMAPSVVVMANNARMEALTLLVLCAAASLILGRSPWVGMALAASAPLVHPQAAPAGVLLLLCALVARERPRWSRQAAVAAAGVAALWAAYGAYVAAHWSDWASDMAYQQSLKAADWAARTWGWGEVLPFVLPLLGAAHAFVVRRPLVLVSLGVALQVPALTTFVFWYEPLQVVGWLLVAAEAVAALEVAARRRRLPDRWRLAALAALLALGARLLWVGGVLEQPGRLDRMTWRCFRMSDAPYVTESEVQAVLALLPPEGRVGFTHRGDALLLAPRLPATAQPLSPTFTDLQPDVVVTHDGPLFRRCGHAPVSAPQVTRDDWSWRVDPRPARAPP